MAYTSSSFEFDASRGLFAGQIDSSFVSAYQLTNTAGAEVDLWPVNANLTWFQTATQLEVLSSSANDAAAGTGARTIVLTGLDTNWNQFSEVVTFNGVTPVLTVNNFRRLNRAFCATSGTWGGINIGNITIRGVGGGAIQGYIEAGNGRLAKSHFSIPAGYNYLIRLMDISAAYSTQGNAPQPVTFRLYIRDGSATAAPFGTKQLAIAYFGIVGAFANGQPFQRLVGPKTDIWMTITPVAANTACACDIQGLVYNI